MSDDRDFFGDVFEDPADDPLLGGEPSPSSSSSSESSSENPQGPPSWMSEERTSNGQATSPDEGGRGGRQAERKEIVVDQRGQAGTGIDELNQAVGQGWRLVRISLAQPNGEQVASRRAAQRFIAILEQDRPQSLFDFGAGV